MKARTLHVTDLVVARRPDPRAEPETPSPVAAPPVDPPEVAPKRVDDIPMRYHHLARVGLVRRVLMAERPGPVRVVAREVEALRQGPKAVTG